MGPILQFIRPHDVFDTATLSLFSDAYDKVSRRFVTVVESLQSFAKLSPFTSSILRR
jgi:hypothetical protein